MCVCLARWQCLSMTLHPLFPFQVEWTSGWVPQHLRKGFRQASNVSAQPCGSNRRVGTQLIRTRREPHETHMPQQRPHFIASIHQRAPTRKKGTRKHPQGRNGGPTFGDAPKTFSARLFRASAPHTTHTPAPGSRGYGSNCLTQGPIDANPESCSRRNAVLVLSP